MRTRAAQRGFTLIELAIVITVSSLLLVGFTHLYDTLRLQQALKITRQRMEVVQQRLDDYADTKERLPCPLPPGSSSLAKEPDACSKAELKPEERDVAIGIVPVAALGLTPQEALDGWGNMFTYAVSAKLTKEKGMRGVEPPAGIIGLVNAYGDNALPAADSGRYVIISHGPHGLGSFTATGARIPCPGKTLSAKNCRAQGVFVTAPWNSHPGPFFFDNIVTGDGGRRQARLLWHMDYCGRQGKYYAPGLFLADPDGCVADDRVHGACTLESAYMRHPSAFDGLTGEWEELPQLGWAPAQTQFWPPDIVGICKCDKNWEKMVIGTWELPLHPQMTAKDSCLFVQAHEAGAIRSNAGCYKTPPSLDIPVKLWEYQYVAAPDGRVWQENGFAVKIADQREWTVLPIFTRDPDTGALIKANGAAHVAGQGLRHIIWSAPLVEINRKMTLYTCLRKSQAMTP